MLPSLEVHARWADHHVWRPGEALYQHPSGAHALWLMLGGSADVSAAGRHWRVLPGHLLLSPQHIRRDIVTPHGAEWLSVGLQALLMGRVDMWQHLTAAVVWDPGDEDRLLLERWLRDLVRERRRASPTVELICDGLARAILGLCLRSVPAGAMPDAGRLGVPTWLVTTLRWVQEQPGTKVGQLAAASGLSPAQFRRRFHEWVGQSPRTYSQMRRLEVAREMLESDLTVSEIARRLGFQSLPHFTRLFARAHGVPPTTYRKQSAQAKL
ncbi:MAG TPA: helix-turn-helix transcriptional regulator [Chloroflexota bacterium]|jgi:AraC-like DNA-binding protein|nr:helix-turn-helix transcriptional regulator [Chloroflexota bacterium]